MIDVMERLSLLQQATDALRLYALVDGVQYRHQRGEPLARRAGFYSLFEGTPDAALANAGPWLIDVEQAGAQLASDIAALEGEAPAVSWLIAPQTLDGLAQLLQLKLNAKMPDGRTALLRFWDPRLLVSLAQVLSNEQRQKFFGHIHEWHFLHNGNRGWIGTPCADA